MNDYANDRIKSIVIVMVMNIMIMVTMTIIVFVLVVVAVVVAVFKFLLSSFPATLFFYLLVCPSASSLSSSMRAQAVGRITSPPSPLLDIPMTSHESYPSQTPLAEAFAVLELQGPVA